MKVNTKLIVIGAIFVVAITFYSTTSHSMPKDAQHISRIDFDCKGLRGVSFREDGSLTINGKSFKLEGGYNEELYFDNKVELIGKIDGEELYFDKSQIKYNGNLYRCNVK
ncbi:hypothetical protein [Yersinia phage vB_YenM_P744]